ncbi:MAG: ABC transporter substrate-binding protein [Deinococcales bacterium]
MLIRTYLLSLTLFLSSLALAGGTLIGGFDVGPGGDPQVIPYHNFAGNTWLAKIYTPLVMMTPDFSEHTSEGALAVSWTANEDATVWTFKLREGVKWHDGEAFSAQDVKFTAELISAPDAVVKRTLLTGEGQPTNIQGWEEYHAGTADEITGIVAADDLTVEFHLQEPDPRFFDSIRWFYILPQHAIDFSPSEFQSTDWWFNKAIGTGPFKLSAFERDQFMELVPNEFYWDGAAKLDKLINRYFVDEAAAVLALQSGDIDFSYVGADVAAKFRDDPDYVIFEGPSFVTNLYNFNYQREAWQDKRVRQAFMYGIDRAAILSDVFNGTAQATPCNDPYPTFWPEDANDYAYDPVRARALLAEAAADGIDVTKGSYEIPTYYTGQLPKDILTVMQANLADIGIDATPLFIDVASWRVKVDEQADFDFTYRGYGAGPAFIGTNWYTEGNQWGLDDPNYESLVADMNKAFTPEAYKAARTELCRYQNEEATFAYFWVSTRYGVAKAGLDNFHYFPAPGGGPYVDHAELWNKE